MFGIIRTGGKQYKVSPGDKIKVEKIDAKSGDDIVIDDVLLVADGDKVSVGTPNVKGSKVKAKVLEHGRAKKKIVFKYKPKTRYRVKRGHRQEYTEIEIKDIS